MFIKIFVLETISPTYPNADTVIVAAFLDAILNKTEMVLCFEPNSKLLGNSSPPRPGHPYDKQICI